MFLLVLQVEWCEFRFNGIMFRIFKTVQDRLLIWISAIFEQFAAGDSI